MTEDITEALAKEAPSFTKVYLQAGVILELPLTAFDQIQQAIRNEFSITGMNFTDIDGSECFFDVSTVMAMYTSTPDSRRRARINGMKFDREEATDRYDRIKDIEL